MKNLRSPFDAIIKNSKIQLAIDLRSLFNQISRELGYQSRLSKRNVRTVSVSTDPPVQSDHAKPGHEYKTKIKRLCYSIDRGK
jgi:hypothetical protein